MLVILGIECLMIESATLSSDRAETIQVSNGWLAEPKTVVVASNRTVKPPEWIPWSFLASGSVVLLYALTIPMRWGGKSEG